MAFKKKCLRPVLTSDKSTFPWSTNKLKCWQSCSTDGCRWLGRDKTNGFTRRLSAGCRLTTKARWCHCFPSFSNLSAQTWRRRTTTKRWREWSRPSNSTSALRRTFPTSSTSIFLSSYWKSWSWKLKLSTSWASLSLLKLLMKDSTRVSPQVTGYFPILVSQQKTHMTKHQTSIGAVISPKDWLILKDFAKKPLKDQWKASASRLPKTTPWRNQRIYWTLR